MKHLFIWNCGFVLAFFIFTFPSLGIAQSPTLIPHQLGRAKNIPKVQCITHDLNNQIYFGTNESLLLYDGFDYTEISFPDSTTNLSITSLLSDQSNTIWIGTNSGELYFLRNGKIEAFLPQIFGDNGKISSISSTSFGMVICSYGAGIYFIKGDSVSKHVNSENGLGDDYTYDAIEHNSYIWVATDAGIAQLSLNGEQIRLFKTKDGLPDNIVHRIIEINDYTLAIGMYDFGVAFFNTSNNQFSIATENYVWDKGPVEALAYRPNGELWVGTKNNGIVCLAYKRDHVHFKALTQINGLISNRINTFHTDLEDNIWIGTQTGASLFSGSTFEFITKQEGLLNSNVFDVLEDFNGKIWIADEAGVQQFTYDQNGEYIWNTIIQNTPEAPIQIVSLFEDRDKNIWMGTYGQGLIKYDFSTKTITRFGAKDGLQNLNILDIDQDAKGRLWLASLGGGVIKASYNEDKIQFERLQSSADIESSSGYIYDIHIDNQQQLFYAADGKGIGVFDCIEDYGKPLDLKDINSKTVYSICSDSDGAIWFSVAEEGLKRLKNGSISSYGSAEGIRSNAIMSIHELPEGKIAVAHDKGIDLIQIANGTVVPYFPFQNTAVFEPNLNGSSLSGSSIFYGIEGGVVKFSPNQDTLKASLPKVWIRNIQVNFNDIPIQNNAFFDFDQNHFVFDYSGTWMKNPSAIGYSYMLEGFDQQWSYETKSLFATYSSLPPGTYTFRIKAKNENGIWSDSNATSYTFSIQKPFWQEWWFYALLIGALILGIYSFLKYRTQKLLEDKRMLENEVSIRTSEIREQKNIIEHKSEEILSSITYAKRIQEAILPPSRLVKELLKESFILYKPKDIVAGDFYWLESKNDIVFFAAADCTGHGVPGAMVSVICVNGLNRAVREFGLTKPGEILDKTRQLVIDQFAQSDEDVKDGMDISLCVLNIKTKELQWAGANNPLWIIRKDTGVIEETKADKQPIGKYGLEKPFTSHSIQLNDGDSIYLFSDGFPDQFGGENGKKLKTKAFKELVLSIQNATMEEQHRSIDTYFENWRGQQEQVDDVCVIGVKI